MPGKILDSSAEEVLLNDDQLLLIYRFMDGPLDPRVSSCVQCRSCVIATEPFSVLLDELGVVYPNESEMISALIELVENSESVHLYFLEENECVHRLWRDPLAREWSSATGEKRLHN